MTRVDVWDGWRGLAISMLMIGHFFNIRSMADDRLGVDLFFVLSGMLMSGILFEQRMPLKKFYVRRFSRIYPALFFFVVFWYGVASFTGWEFQLREIFANLTFIRTYYPADPHIWNVHVPMGHLWSLNVEEHAYVIMSVITLILVKKRQAAIALAVLGAMAIGISFYYYYGKIMPETHFRIRTESALSFVFLSASWNLLKKQYGIRLPGWAPALLSMAAACCYFYRFPHWLTFAVTPVLLAIAVNHLQDAARWFQALLLLAPLRRLGLWSYSIYLWQQPFYKGANLLPGGKLTGCVLAIAAGAASYHLIEQPLRSRINQYWGSRRDADAGVKQ